MDRNTITGIILLVGLFIAFNYFTKPSEAELVAQKRVEDSLRNVASDNAEKSQAILTNKEEVSVLGNNIDAIDTDVRDSVTSSMKKQEYGSFYKAVDGEEGYVTIENNLMKVKIAKKGGRIYSVELKDYQTYSQEPLVLFDGDSTQFGFTFFENLNLKNHTVFTNDLYFEPQESEELIIVDSGPKSIIMRLSANDDIYIDYQYTVEPNSGLIDFDVTFVGMNNIISDGDNYVSLTWDMFLPSTEKGKEFENRNSQLYYKYFEGDIDYLSETGDDDDEVVTKVKWIAFKQQFFSSIFMADNYISNDVKLSSNEITDHDGFLKIYSAAVNIPFDQKPTESYNYSFYFGANHYNTLKSYDEDFEKLVPLGWGIFGWINKIAVIPIFNWLGKYFASYGVIILLLTIILKMVLFPLTYKSYLSTAKMRVLKPQIDEIHSKIPKEKSMERQQATMALYKKAGVNPMGGCIPMLIQMPILFAMFRFFPASIELRQKAFLWAEDLSAYDSIYDLPFTIPAYGDHISLFCLLMGVTNLIYTVMNNQQMSMGSNQMPGMKMMMYMMPIMFLVFFNNYASGLSYYYFIATLITILQTTLIKRFVDDKAILSKLEEAKKKPPKKKSNFQSRLDDMAKQKGIKTPKR